MCAYLEKGTPDERIDEIRKEIEKIDNIGEIEFVSEDEALNMMLPLIW